MNTRSLSEAAGRLSKCRRIVAFTGAGVSAESGIPTFRGEGGIWENYDPDVYGNLPGLAMVWLKDPGNLLRFVTDAIRTFLSAEPNAAHTALGLAESAGRLSAVVTQNIDDLHERGGNRQVFKLHGDLYTMRCLKCEGRAKLDRAAVHDMLHELEGMQAGRIALLKRIWEILPRCAIKAGCGGMTRPDVVFFGESLPADVLQKADQCARDCDALLIIGTSGVVYPAALIPQVARSHNALVIEVNGEATPYTSMSDFSFIGKAGDIVPRLLGVESN